MGLTDGGRRAAAWRRKVLLNTLNQKRIYFTKDRVPLPSEHSQTNEYDPIIFCFCFYKVDSEFLMFARHRLHILGYGFSVYEFQQTSADIYNKNIACTTTITRKNQADHIYIYICKYIPGHPWLPKTLRFPPNEQHLRQIYPIVRGPYQCFCRHLGRLWVSQIFRILELPEGERSNSRADTCSQN